MTRIPKDVVDLALAPVALLLEDRIESLSGLDDHDLDLLVVLATGEEPHTPAERRDALLGVIAQGDDLHGWECSWSPRGLVAQHGSTHLTLGLPATLRSYVQTG